MAVTTNLNANFLRRPRPVDRSPRAVAEMRQTPGLWRGDPRDAGAPEDPVCHVTLTYALPPADAG